MSLTTPLSNADATIVAAGIWTGINTETKIAGLTNQSYSGQLQGIGSQVKIITIDGGDDLHEYVPADPEDGFNALDLEIVTDDSVWVKADQAAYFNVAIDRVVAAAGATDHLRLKAEAKGKKAALKIDTYIASVWAADAGVDLGTAVDLSAEGAAYDYLLDSLVLFEGNGTDLVAVGSQAFINSLIRDRRFTQGTPAGQAALYNGVIGEAGGITVVKSNVQGADTVLMRSHREAVASVKTVDEVTRYELGAAGFGEAVKGLIVYGAKIVHPECAGAGTVVFTSGD